MIYAAAKFEAATSNGLEVCAFTRKPSDSGSLIRYKVANSSSLGVGAFKRKYNI